MVRPKSYKEEDILDLLDNEWRTTLAITKKGKTLGLYSRWESYKSILENLYKKGFIDKMEISGISKNQTLWRRK